MYKIEIWQWYSLVGVYEDDNIQNIIAWYKWYWSGTYGDSKYSIRVYKNGIEYTFEEIWDLGFYK